MDKTDDFSQGRVVEAASDAGMAQEPGHWESRLSGSTGLQGREQEDPTYPWSIAESGPINLALPWKTFLTLLCSNVN